MKIQTLLLTVLVAALTSLVVMHFTGGATTTAKTETAYERVMRTGVLRCGYAIWPPNVFVKDPQTGKVSGIFVDISEAIAAKLKIKIEWAEETGWGSFIESLKSQRIDAMCSAIWRNGERGRYVAFDLPVFYNGVYPYVAVGDHRFDNDVSLANQQGMKVSAMDGEMSDVIAKEHFPKAEEISIPQLGQITDTLMAVATHKADITFTNMNTANDFIKANLGKLRLAQDKPFQVFPTSWVVDIHETQLSNMIDSAIAELQNSGVIDNILKKYDADPKEFMRVAKPYQQ